MGNVKKFTREISQDALVTEKSDIFLNGLLGVYDKNGNYFISPKIVDELITLEKAKKYVFDNSIYCESNIPGIGEIMFQIEYSKIDDNNSSAKLYLLENVYKINGYLQNTIKTFLTEFIDSFNNFIEKSYSAFNIVVDYDENGRNKKVSMDTYLDYYLMSKKQYLIAVQNQVQPKLDDLYKRYFSKKVKILNSANNPFSKSVLQDFKDEYEKIEKKFLKDCDYKTINELLDKCVEDISDTKDSYEKFQIDFAEKSKPALQEFYKDSNEIFEEAENSAINHLYKKDKQRVNEINATEQEFVDKAVSNSNLSSVIDALSVDDYVGTENDYEDEKADSIEDIINKVKSQSKETSNNGNKVPTTIKKNVLKKQIEIISTSEDEQFAISNQSEHEIQELQNDDQGKEHPQLGIGKKDILSPREEKKIKTIIKKNIDFKKERTESKVEPVSNDILENNYGNDVGNNNGYNYTSRINSNNSKIISNNNGTDIINLPQFENRLNVPSNKPVNEQYYSFESDSSIVETINKNGDYLQEDEQQITPIFIENDDAQPNFSQNYGVSGNEIIDQSDLRELRNDIIFENAPTKQSEQLQQKSTIIGEFDERQSDDKFVSEKSEQGQGSEIADVQDELDDSDTTPKKDDSFDFDKGADGSFTNRELQNIKIDLDRQL